MSVFTLVRPHVRSHVRAVGRTGQVPASITGATAWLRPLEPGETEPLQAVFEAMSPESRYGRYLQGMSTLTPGMQRALTAVDGVAHVAWLATVDERPVGLARYVSIEPDAAEVAFEVADAFHGLGLGAALLDAVTTVAAAAGIRRLQATVLSSNHRSRRLLAQVGLGLAPVGDGTYEGDGPFHLFERPRVDREKVLRVAFPARPLAA